MSTKRSSSGPPNLFKCKLVHFYKRISFIEKYRCTRFKQLGATCAPQVVKMMHAFMMYFIILANLQLPKFKNKWFSQNYFCTIIFKSLKYVGFKKKGLRFKKKLNYFKRGNYNFSIFIFLKHYGNTCNLFSLNRNI